MKIERVRFEPLSFVAIVALGVLFAIPLLGLFQDEEDLARRQNRALNEAPEWSTLVSEPSRFFAEGRAWLSDRALFSVDASVNYRKFKYYALGDSPAANVAREGDLVLPIATDAANIDYVSVTGSCPTENDWDQMTQSLTNGWAEINRAAELAGLSTFGVIVPSKPVLYADRLPRSIPSEIRAQCVYTAENQSPAVRIASSFPDTLTYPLAEFMAERDVDHFYPLENFHADGMAASRAAQSLIYLSSLEPFREPDFTVREGNADMEPALGFARRVNFQRPDYVSAADRSNTLDREVQQGAGLRANQISAFYNANAADPRRVVIIANSFGARIAPDIASHYAETVQINTNGMNRQTLVRMFRYLMSGDFDQILFVMHEPGYYNRVRLFADAMLEATSLEPDETAGARVADVSFGTVSFTEFNTRGWLPPGQNTELRWSKGGRPAFIDIPRSLFEEGNSIQMRVRLFGPEISDSRWARVLVCGQEDADITDRLNTSLEPQILEIEYDAECGSQMTIEFQSSEQPSGADLGLSQDRRQLGVRIDEIQRVSRR